MDDQVLGLDLSDLPVNALVEIDGSMVCLRLMTDGALLSAELGAETGPASVKHYLELGFSNALEFDAGLAVDPVRQRLVLTHWLAGATTWASAATALELLLNQVDVCRAAGKKNVQQAPIELSRRNVEKLLRSRISR